MKKQNHSPQKIFIVQRQCPHPHFLFPAQRIANLEFKVAFFEGQLDPLQFQNIDLKETVIQLLRLISINTDILRRLIPAENPALQHNIDMASFSEIAAMIEQEWKQMDRQIKAFPNIKQKLMQVTESQRKRYLSECELRESQKLQFERLRCNMQEQILTLHAQISKLDKTCSRQAKEAERQRESAEARLQSLMKEMRFKQYDSKCKQEQNQRCTNRLNKTIDTIRFEFQENKSALKALYDKISNDKLTEQAETFRLMLKMKQDQKFKLDKQLYDIRQLHALQLEEKEEKASRLRERIEQEKRRIVELQDKIYRMKEDNKSSKMQYKAMEAELHSIKENIAIAQGTTARREATIIQMEIQQKKTIQSFQEQIKQIIRRRDQRNSILQSENGRQAQLIDNLYKQLQTLKKRLAFIDRQCDQKIKQKSESQKEIEKQLKQEISRWQKTLKEQKSKASVAIQNKEKQIDKIKEYYQKMIAKVEKDAQVKREQVIKEMIIQKKKQAEKTEDEIIQMRIKLKTQRQNQDQAIMEQSLRIREQYQMKMSEFQTSFVAEKKKYEQKWQICERDDKTFRQQLQKMSRKLRQSQDKMQKKKANHIREIAKLQGKNAELILSWQARMDKQLDEFQTSLIEREKEFGRREIQMYVQLQEMQIKVQTKQKQLVQFKGNQQKAMQQFKEANGINHIQRRHADQISEMKTAAIRKQLQLQASYDSKIRQLNDEFLRDKQQLTNFYKQKISKIEKYMEQMLVQIGIKLFSINIDIQKNIQKQTTIIERLNSTQKLKYLHANIEAIANYINNQRKKLNQVSQRLMKIQQAIQLQVQKRKVQIQTERAQAMGDMSEKIAMAQEQYKQKWQQKQAQLKQKDLQLQKKWKGFSQFLYEQFKFLSDTHQKQYAKLMLRYTQLEKIYESRPSRAEDIFKIKQLTGIRNKLQQNISILNRKFQTANEIVQYLNMELQNYKQVYDIFSPNNQIGNKTISFNFDAQKMEKYRHFLQKKAKQEVKTKSFTKNTQNQQKASPFFEVHNKNEGKNIFNAQKIQKEDDNDFIFLQSKQANPKNRKQSHLSNRKPWKQSLKTQRSLQINIKNMDLFEKTSNFLKMASTPPAVDPFRQTDNDNKMKNYRRRRVKRLSTTREDHFY